MKEPYFKDCCIVNYSSGSYKIGQSRLKQSLIDNDYDGNFLFFDDSDTCFKPQEEEPFAFKPLSMYIAIKKGYKYILWLDANMICIRKPKKIFSIIKQDGIFVYSPYTSNMGTWCSDFALEKFEITREDAFNITELCSAAFGVNSKCEKAMIILDEWKNFANDGITFKGIPAQYSFWDSFTNKTLIVSKDNRVKGHRHDQTALSFLSWKYKLDIHYLEIKDVYAGNTKNIKHKYSKGIAFDIELAHNRDTKTQIFLKKYDRWGNTKGLNKFCFICLSFIDTIRRRLFFITKR